MAVCFRPAGVAVPGFLRVDGQGLCKPLPSIAPKVQGLLKLLVPQTSAWKKAWHRTPPAIEKNTDLAYFLLPGLGGWRPASLHMIHVNSLDGIDLFSTLSGEERLAVAESMSLRTFEPNQAVVWIGDPATEFFVIVSGSVEVCVPDETGREMRMSVIGPGEYFGELALFDRGTRSSTVRSIEALEVLVLTHDAFHRCLREHPSIAIHVLEVFGRRQRQLLERLRGVRNVNEIIEQKLTTWQQVANFIAETAANPWFLTAHAVTFSAWIIANSILGPRRWDPYPFPFLCFWASVEAIFLSLFILVSQATQGQKDRLRNEQDFQVAVKLQFEISRLHAKLDRLAGVETGQAVKQQSSRLTVEAAPQSTENNQ
jgi:uncharacterized membrane protein